MTGIQKAKSFVANLWSQSVNNNKKYAIGLIGISLVTLAPIIMAAEGANYGGPVGGTDIQAAMLPPVSGWYGGVVAGYANGNKFYDKNGDQDRNIHAHISSEVAAAGLLYVYPQQLWGGTLATSLQGSMNKGRISLNGSDQNYKGFGDLYSDLLIWSKYLGDSPAGQPPTGLTVKLAYSMVFPTGRYNTSDLYTSGRNVFFFIPNAAATYLTKSGLELSGHAFANIASENKATDYDSGTVLNLNFAVSQHVGLWQLGMAGYYAKQVSDDHIDGEVVEPDGRRYSGLAVGPVVSYDIPAWKSNIKFKALAPLQTENSLAANTAYVVFSKAF